VSAEPINQGLRELLTENIPMIGIYKDSLSSEKGVELCQLLYLLSEYLLSFALLLFSCTASSMTMVFPKYDVLFALRII